MSEDTNPRRRRREEAQVTAEAQAAIDGAMRKGNEKDAASNVPVAPRQPAPLSKANRRKAAAELAKAQAEVDARLRADTTPLAVMPQNRPLTLHEQNLLARARDKELRDVARDAGKAAGKAAFEVLVGRVGPDATKARRYRTIAAAEKSMVEAQRRAAGGAKE